MLSRIKSEVVVVVSSIVRYVQFFVKYKGDKKSFYLARIYLMSYWGFSSGPDKSRLFRSAEKKKFRNRCPPGVVKAIGYCRPT